MAKMLKSLNVQFVDFTHVLFPLPFEKSLHFGEKLTPSVARIFRSRNSSVARFFFARVEHLPRTTSDERLVAPAEAPVSFMRVSTPYVPAITQIKLR